MLMPGYYGNITVILTTNMSIYRECSISIKNSVSRG